MSNKSSTALAEVRAKFENWRAKRKRRCPIPNHLWNAAISLLPLYPVMHIVRELHRFKMRSTALLSIIRWISIVGFIRKK
jgi:hypothetical protein